MYVGKATTVKIYFTDFEADGLITELKELTKESSEGEHRFSKKLLDLLQKQFVKCVGDVYQIKRRD